MNNPSRRPEPRPLAPTPDAVDRAVRPRTPEESPEPFNPVLPPGLAARLQEQAKGPRPRGLTRR